MMYRFPVALAFLIFCVVVSAQEWVEQDDVEYNCGTINAILADYGRHAFARYEGQVASVKDIFERVFPYCPDADVSESEVAEADAGGDATDRAAETPEDGRFSFSSSADGQQPALGPITLPKGLYHFTLVTTDAISVEPITLSDDCGFDFLFKKMRSRKGKASSGIHNLFAAETDCDLILQVQHVQEEWTLDIKRVDPDRPPAIEIATGSYSVSSDDEGYQPVLGPIKVAAGTYTVTATTDDFFNVKPYPLSADCGLDPRLHILFLGPGEASEGAETVIEVESDCILLLDIEGLVDDWTLVFEMAS